MQFMPEADITHLQWIYEGKTFRRKQASLMAFGTHHLLVNVLPSRSCVPWLVPASHCSRYPELSIARALVHHHLPCGGRGHHGGIHRGGGEPEGSHPVRSYVPVSELYVVLLSGLLFNCLSDHERPVLLHRLKLQ